ncbi:toll/interleukin-1 receptor domain-containing protein [Nocardia amikacinitolerans]|uniref:toll/interleukin-1 receptor domain-containing protein n=1 Tax=Nocardia amikacinitolerans TaxID=756689 RepID=UPI00367FEC37
MRRLFVSYARENKPDVEKIVRHLAALDYQTWFDSSLRGGQTWWEEILRRIAECDAFVAIVSRDSLDSVACKRELEWALAVVGRDVGDATRGVSRQGGGPFGGRM